MKMTVTSRGTAYVFDRERAFRQRCNLEMVELLPLVDDGDVWLVHGLIENHLRLTQSPLAKRILHNWEHLVPLFVKVMPTEYKKVLATRRLGRTSTGEISVTGAPAAHGAKPSLTLIPPAAE